MDWNRRLRIGRTPVVGALVAAGVVGAALLAGPMASSQAADAYTYPNGGICYQNPDGEDNIHRLHFYESGYRPDSDSVFFQFKLQKWDDSSGQYQYAQQAFVVSRVKKDLKPGTDYHADANLFCKSVTEDPLVSPNLGGTVYGHGEYTSWQTVASQSQPGPKP